MTAAWMLYAAAVGLALGAAAWAAERALLATQRAARWAWTLGLAGSVVVPVAGLAAHMATHAAAPPTSAGAAVVHGAAPRGRAVIAAAARGAEPGAPAATRRPFTLPIRAVLPPFAAPAPWGVLDRPLAVLWALVSTVLLARLAGRARSTRRARAAWPAHRVHGATVRISADVGPAVLGAFRPVLVLPRWTLGDARLPLMLAHEQEHVSARDPLLLAVASLACVLAPWNPALWWQHRRLRDAVELDCDRRTLRRAAGRAVAGSVESVPGAAAGAYGRLLLDVADRAWRAPRAAAPGLALTPRSSTLRRRLTVMTAPRAPRPLAPACAMSAALLAVLAAAVPRPAPAAPVRATRSRPADGWLAAAETTAGQSATSAVAGPRLAMPRGRVVGRFGPEAAIAGVVVSESRRPVVPAPGRSAAAQPGAVAALDTTPTHATRRAADGAYRAVVHDSAGTVELTPLDSEGQPSGPAIVHRVVRMGGPAGERGILDSVAVVVDGHALQNYLRSFRTLPPDSIATVRVSPGTYVAMHDSAGRRVRGPAVDLSIVQITTKRAATLP